MSIIPIEIQPYFVLAATTLLFLAIYRELVKPAVGFILCILSLIITGIITADDALEGFSNESIASVALLLLISAGLRGNFGIERLIDRFFAKATGYNSFLAMLMASVALLSSFINNTPVVAMMAPYVFNWGREHNISPSKLLIPLSYATIMGGMLTFIGTSTTLVLIGFLQDFGLPVISPIALLTIGGAAALVGILFMLVVGHRLLPDHVDILKRFQRNKREYLVEKKLHANSPLIGKSVGEGGLRNLKGVYLVEIVREGRVVSPVPPTETIQPDDTLIFAGNTENIIDLTRSGNGLELPKPRYAGNGNRVNITEAVISNNSSLIGKTVKASKFRNRYDAAVVAIHRNGEKISGKLGEVTLKAGDALLLFAGNDFDSRLDLHRDLFLISQSTASFKDSKKGKGWLLLAACTAFCLLFVGYFNLFTTLLTIFSSMMALGMITAKDVKRNLDINMLVIMVFSLALGQAMIKTQAGDLLGGWVLGLFSPLGLIGILGGIMALTTLLTSFISNVGAISIAFPLALSVTNQLGIDGAPFYLAIAFAASTAFLTPMGYQTNLIIFGPGGYSFKDFFRVGLPITVVYLIAVMIGLVLLYPDVFIL